MPAADNAAVVRSPARTSVYARRKHKPGGLPSVTAMVTAVLKETPGLRPP